MTDNEFLSERSKHLQWCKERAFEYLNTGDILNAWTSFFSDMNKNEETSKHPALNATLATLNMNSILQMRNYIDGFN